MHHPIHPRKGFYYGIFCFIGANLAFSQVFRVNEKRKPPFIAPLHGVIRQAGAIVFVCFAIKFAAAAATSLAFVFCLKEDAYCSSSGVYLGRTSLSLGLKDFFVFLRFFWKKSFFFFWVCVCPVFLHPALDFLSFLSFFAKERRASLLQFSLRQSTFFTRFVSESFRS